MRNIEYLEPSILKLSDVVVYVDCGNVKCLEPHFYRNPKAKKLRVRTLKNLAK